MRAKIRIYMTNKIISSQLFGKLWNIKYQISWSYRCLNFSWKKIHYSQHETCYLEINSRHSSNPCKQAIIHCIIKLMVNFSRIILQNIMHNFSIHNKNSYVMWKKIHNCLHRVSIIGQSGTWEWNWNLEISFSFILSEKLEISKKNHVFGGISQNKNKEI